MTSRIRKIILPESRLSDNFPWTAQTAGKKYLLGLLHFSIGSFAPPLLVMLGIFGLISIPAMRDCFLNIGSTVMLLGSVTAITAALAAGLHALYLKRRNSVEIGSKLRKNALRYLLCGGLASVALTWFLAAIDPFFPKLINWIAVNISQENGKPNVTFVMWLSLISFVGGFGMQLRFIARELRKDGLSLRDAMALTLKPLRGSYWGSTFVNLLLPVAVAYGLTQLVGEGIVAIMGSAHQPTVELAKQATGGNFFLFALMAVVGAPIFEELVFRGFLYQVIRCSLKQELKPLTLKELPKSGFNRLWVAFCNQLSRVSYRLQKALGGKRSEVSAIVLSSLIFALMHMQFQPTTMVLLFLLGCVQAEIFRRSGSLYTGMLLHAVNNGIDVLKLALGHA
ncbi:MAG: CPBP family intramembrane metalloprotease [Candidatus Obscuribacterales bacterium]|nr:CPBP family intramembrane metalloprotease [Candidatus Obscuribacterales bacterium]